MSQKDITIIAVKRIGLNQIKDLPKLFMIFPQYIICLKRD